MTDVAKGVPETEASGPPPLLQLDEVTVRFPGVLALDSVNFDLRAGEVHVLFGENGAGKSTLISLVAGAYHPTGGSIRLRGRRVELDTVHAARELGISAVFQEFSLVPQLTIEENLFLGAEHTRGGALRKQEMRRQARELLERLGFPLDPESRVVYLPRAEQQMVEIAKAFRTQPSVLIFDEPTSSLTERETERLFAMIEQAKNEGVGIIYITHRMSEIKRIGDRITVLRDGRYVATLDVAEASEERLVQLMTGRVISQIFPTINFHPEEPLLQIEGLWTKDGSVQGASLYVLQGEVVGLAGLVGSGKSEIGRASFGLEDIRSGTVRFCGQDVTGLRPRQMLDRGLFYVPPDRRTEGLVLVRSVRENIVLPSLNLPEFSRGPLLRLGAERARARQLAQRLNLQPPRLERDVEHFSGGNQQKVMLAKALTRDVKLFIFDEPTVGVDVGTRVAIYEFIRELCEEGHGVLLISSDLPEILHLTRRTYVVHRGELRAELVGDEITEERVLSVFFEREVA
ncbi:MAG: sugar ABC transporter ATP-binding protein [Arenicellales bacterium]